MDKRKAVFAVTLLTVLGGVLRFANLDTQSFWFDEALTETVIRSNLADTMSEVRGREATPPFYYALLWLWSRLFGEGDVALRSLSALLGTAAIPVTYLAARDLVSRRAGVIAAALVATTPYLLWYSQEARSYALASLLAALTLLFLARRKLLLWGVACALLLATHYFSAFLIAVEAAWLLKTLGIHRRLLAAFALPAASLLLLAPLALHQRKDGRADWIDNFSLGGRVSESFRKFVSGHAGAPGQGLGLLAAVLIAAGGLLLILRVRGDERRGALLAFGLAAIAGGVAVILSLGGFDYLYHRNLLVLWIPLAVALAAGFASARVAGTALAALLCLTFAAIHVAVVRDESYHRLDWEGAVNNLGRSAEPRGVAVSPQFADDPLIHYGMPLVEWTQDPPDVRELVVVGEIITPSRLEPGRRIGKFRVVSRSEHNGVWTAVMRADEPQPLVLGYVKGEDVGAANSVRVLLDPGTRTSRSTP